MKPSEPNEMFDTSTGSFRLRRGNDERPGSLQAWDAADEYVLGYISGAAIGWGGANVGPATLPKSGRWLFLNDAFGALSVATGVSPSDSMGALSPPKDGPPIVVTDSLLARQAIVANIAANGMAPESVQILNSVEPLGPALVGPALVGPALVGPALSKPENFALVIIKIPKSLAMLEDQLHRLRPHIDADTLIVGAGMVKSIHTSTLDLFSRIIGPTVTSLAKKKARLILAKFDPELDPGASPHPCSFVHDGMTIVSHASVFSRAKLDIGTRFLYEHLQSRSLDSMLSDTADTKVADLGCGSGLLGISLLRRYSSIKVRFSDESFMAVESARASCEASFGDIETGGVERAEFCAEDCLGDAAPNSLQLVVCNPPFHHGHTISDATARRMFLRSRDALEAGGRLLVVANRHLGYHVRLKRLFGNVASVAANKKFVVLSSEC